MPNRILKESITTSRTIDSLSADEERLFYRLIVVCDDYGRFDADPKIVLGRCFSLKIGSVKPRDVGGWLDRLEQVGLLRRYVASGQPYLQMTTWDKHQQIRARRSRYPEPSAGPCHQLISSDINGLQMQSNVPVIQSNPIQYEVCTSAQHVAPPSAPGELREFDFILREFAAYVPSQRFYADVAAKYSHLDLREEAIKMTSWLREKNKRKCSIRFVLNWLGSAAASYGARARAPNGQANQRIINDAPEFIPPRGEP